jgi:hypothetical protein
MSDDALEIQPEDVIAGRAIPAEMVHDLRAIAQLDARTVERIVEQLSQIQGLTAKESVKEGVQSCLPDSNADLADKIVRTLLNMGESDADRVVKTVDRWRGSTPDRGAFFTDEMFVCLEHNLETLAVKLPSVELLRKANNLLREVGNEFKGIAFFCDMRPVFDESRERVEGFVLLANMRLKYVSQDGERHACEVALTEDELKTVVKSAEKALAKLEVLKATSSMFASSNKQ